MISKKEVIIIKTYDTAIIGAGPVGLFAAGYAAMNGLKTVVFDSLSAVGGEAEFLYPFKEIINIPAYQTIVAADLIKRLKENVSDDVDFVLDHKVAQVEKQDDNFIIDSDWSVRSVIIATGAGSFTPKKFPLKMSPEIAERVHYYVRQPQNFAGQQVGIFGGGDSALDWANGLAKVANVTMIHRREHFRGMESTLAKLKSLKNVEILTPYLPRTIELADNQLKLGLRAIGSKELVYRSFDQIVVAYGFKANNRFVANWGVEATNTNVLVDRTMATNVAGIYAVGDVVTYEGRVPLIGVGFGEAQTAVHAIMRELFPENFANN